MLALDLVVPASASPIAVAATLDVASAANRLAGRTVLDVRLLGLNSQEQTRGGLIAPTVRLKNARPRDIVVVAGGGMASEVEVADQMATPQFGSVARWLASAARRGSEMAASCSGVFALGAAGLLDGRRCTTTWWLVSALQARFPTSRVETDAMVVSDGAVWTAGAAFAHIDLMLAILARHTGLKLAEDVARRLVVDQRTSQARYVIPSHLVASDPIAVRVEAFARPRLRQSLRLEDIAAEVGASPRTLSRRVRAATGLSPMRLVQKIRLDTALHLLSSTRLSMDAIAQQVGFEDPVALYRLITRHTGARPSSFRHRAL